VGGFEVGIPVSMEPTLKYHPNGYGYLTATRKPGPGQRMVGSLTGAVASQKVTEAREVPLSVIGNHALSVNT
jgi:hypothetical protein